MKKQTGIYDPVYGYIRIPEGIIFDIIEHPLFQRLRRIRQLGLTDFVYPGALHTRFHHAVGAMHLMREALQSLRDKDHNISDLEFEAAMIAILLHDIGHGPFSHVLESSILKDTSHEKISVIILNKLSEEYGRVVQTATEMFLGSYPRPFFHQLVSSQLDIDRLDYLNRDCFFTGVSEGKVGAERIIKMMNIIDNEIVIEEKGIYSIENFLNARRIMYWQVYLHKTVVSAEEMLVKIIERAGQLTKAGEEIPASNSLLFFLQYEIAADQFENDPDCLKAFEELDDFDIWAALKIWRRHPDPILSYLSKSVIERKLFKISFTETPASEDHINMIKKSVADKFRIDYEDADYLVPRGAVTNAAYIAHGKDINILTKKGEVIDIAKAADLPNISAMSKIVKKHFFCHPKNVSLPTNCV